MIVVDASVILKWFALEEEYRENALLLKDRHALGKERIIGPELLLYEVANVLRMKRDDLQSAVEAFSAFCSVGIEVHALEPSDLTEAMRLSHAYGISTYDASYLALAQAQRCRLVTADERFLARLKGVPHVLSLKDIIR